MEEYSCEITKADNGFILKWKEEIDEETSKNCYEVFEEKYYFSEDIFVDKELVGVEEEKVAFTDLVYGLAKHFNIPYEKYGDKNLRISWDKKGHKID